MGVDLCWNNKKILGSAATNKRKPTRMAVFDEGAQNDAETNFPIWLRNAG